jgi:alkanesulfonate monooxygenase SsuD/methylene tetrahydromethanopterin reductase-like flavin-dependent oxidoreductase (luciferase family)
MNLGFFTMPIHPLDKDWRQSLREDREAYILADELGFTEAYCGEHATDMAENITSCAVFLATLVGATKKIRLGTGTVNMPNTHPVAVASHLAMLDHLLDGRFIFGISPGGLLSDAEAYGNLGKDRAEMFLEAINTVLAIWAGEAPYNIQGTHWSVTTEKTFVPEIGQGIIPKPLQRPHPPIVVTAVAPFSKGVTEAAARGWEPISANFLMPQWVKSHWPKYVEGCAKAGRPADPANWRVAKSIFVCEDEAKARDYVTGPNSPYRFYYSQLLTKMRKGGRLALFKTHMDQPDDEVTLDGIFDRLVFWGSPERVADKILAFREEVGDFGTLLYAGKDWTDYDLGRRSMALLAEKTMPIVNAAIAREAVRVAAE